MWLVLYFYGQHSYIIAIVTKIIGFFEQQADADSVCLL